MKRIVSLLLAGSMAASLMACGPAEGTAPSAGDQPSAGASETQPKEEVVTIRAASLTKESMLPFFYISENGMDTQNGFKLELSAYESGALVNEALGAGLWDVTALGSASVMSMAKYDCVQLFAFQEVGNGINAMVRPDSEIMSVKGWNPDYPDVYGSPDTVRGKTILVTIGSGNHMQISAWLKAIGLTDADVNLVHMEYAQAWQAFNSGEGDVFSSTPPYTTYALDAGYSVASDFKSVGITYANNILSTKEFYESHHDTLVKLMEQVILADEALKDPETVVKYGLEWFALNGNEIKEEDADFLLIPYYGVEEVKSDDFVPGDALRAQADFSFATGSITQEEYDAVLQNIKDDVYQEARAALGA